MAAPGGARGIVGGQGGKPAVLLSAMIDHFSPLVPTNSWQQHTHTHTQVTHKHSGKQKHVSHELCAREATGKPKMHTADMLHACEELVSVPACP